MAGEKPVIFEEIGWPTYDENERVALGRPPGSQFPAPPSFYDPGQSGEKWQARFLELVFSEWDKWKLRIPLITLFTAFEQHVEGDGCSLLPEWLTALQDLFPNVNFPYTTCDPTQDASCRLCDLGELVDWLGQYPNERGKRFFGSCGLIRSNGVRKLAWDALRAHTLLRRQQYAAP